ncbi:MAG: hypothetical protein Q7S82_00440 [bacterium]|nr:hypothetical protein [bacterium]
MARILAWRSWRVRWSTEKKGFVLRSVYIDFSWFEANVTADQEPEQIFDAHHYGRLHGLHAILAGAKNRYFLPAQLSSSSCCVSNSDFPSSRLIVLGAIEPYGRIVGHEDGVIRSEKMRILALRVEEFGRIPDCKHSYYILRDFFPEVQKISALTIPCNLCADSYCSFLATSRIRKTSDNIFTKEEIERQLLLFYEVPRLPVDVGPWKSPWGGGPEWMPPREWLL